MIDARKMLLSAQAFAATLVAAMALYAVPTLANLANAENPPPQKFEERYGDENIAVTLFADGAPEPGKTWMLALRFRPNEAGGDEWHGYWSNPGDAGQGMLLMLDLPESWEVGEPLYPVPERFVQALPDTSLMNHIYKGEYAVLVPVEVPADADVVDMAPITGFAEYLACTDILCVPQDAVLEQRIGGDFARWRAEVAPLLDARASRSIVGQELRIAIPLPGSVALPNPHAFVADERLVDYSATQTFRRDGDLLTVQIPLDEYGDGAAGDVSGILSFGDGTGVRFVASPGDVALEGEVIAGPVGMNTPALWTLILGALVGGLLLNVMPCVFPILSLKAISLARAGESEAQARGEGIAYTAGVILACVGLGALMLALRAAGEQVGWAFQLQEPGVVIALLLLATAITVNFAGLFELPSISITRSGQPASAFATGLLAAIAATPCTGPFMAAALGAALLLPPVPALLLFAMLGLGLALPFLLIGFVPAWRSILPKPGVWMETFRKAMAIPMGLTALALIWLTAQLGGATFALMAAIAVFGLIVALLVVGRLQKRGKAAWPAFSLIAGIFLGFAAFVLPLSYARQDTDLSASIHDPVEFSRAALTEARATGQPVFLWFTADWCVTCKVNESVAIERESVRQAFEAAGVVTMVGDWTRRDEAITMFLTERGAAGVPLYLWYMPGEDGEQLPQVLTPDMLTSRAMESRLVPQLAADRIPDQPR